MATHNTFIDDIQAETLSPLKSMANTTRFQ